LKDTRYAKYMEQNYSILDAKRLLGLVQEKSQQLKSWAGKVDDTPGKPAMATESDEAMMTNLARIAQAYRTHSPSLFSFYTSYITSVQLADILIFLSSSEAGYKPPKDSEKKIDPDMLQAILNIYLPRKVVQPSGARIRNRHCKPSITSGFP